MSDAVATIDAPQVSAPAPVAEAPQSQSAPQAPAASSEADLYALAQLALTLPNHAPEGQQPAPADVQPDAQSVEGQTQQAGAIAAPVETDQPAATPSNQPPVTRPSLDTLIAKLDSTNPAIQRYAAAQMRQHYPEQYAQLEEANNIVPEPQAPPPITPQQAHQQAEAEFQEVCRTVAAEMAEERSDHQLDDNGKLIKTTTFDPKGNPDHLALFRINVDKRLETIQKDRQRQYEEMSTRQQAIEYNERILPERVGMAVDTVLSGVPVKDGRFDNTRKYFEVGGEYSPTLEEIFRNQVPGVLKDPATIRKHEQAISVPPHQLDRELRRFDLDVAKTALVKAMSTKAWKDYVRRVSGLTSPSAGVPQTQATPPAGANGSAKPVPPSQQLRPSLLGAQQAPAPRPGPYNREAFKTSSPSDQVKTLSALIESGAI